MKLGYTAAGVGFVLLYPGFLFYHFAAGAFGMPEFLGGMYGVLSAGFAITLLILLPKCVSRWQQSGRIYLFAVMGFILYVLLWTGAHALLIRQPYITPAVIQSIQTVVLWLALVLIGALVPVRSRAIRKLFVLSFFLVLTFLIGYVVITGDLMFFARRYYSAEDIASYQGFARSVLVIVLYLLACSTSLGSRFALIVGGIFVLFLLGARSEFFGLLAVLAILVPLSARFDRKYLIATIIAAGAVVAVYSAQHNELLGSRQLEVVNLGSSSSWVSRERLQADAWAQIRQSPLFGYFGGHIAQEGGTVGRYSHNALSAWVNYGALGFSWYLILTLIASFWSLKRLVVDKKRTSIWLFSFLINWACFVLLVAAKSVFWPLPALGWGLYLQASVIHDQNQQSGNRPVADSSAILKGNS